MLTNKSEFHGPDNMENKYVFFKTWWGMSIDFCFDSKLMIFSVLKPHLYTQNLSLTKTLLYTYIFIKTLFSMFIKPFCSRGPLAAPNNWADFRFYYPCEDIQSQQCGANQTHTHRRSALVFLTAQTLIRSRWTNISVSPQSYSSHPPLFLTTEERHKYRQR